MNAGYVNVKNSSGSSGSSTNTNSGVGLVRPRVYFDESVKEGLGGAELTRLEKIVERFGGTVVRDGKEIDNTYHGIGIMGVTHIVGYDPEEHDAVEVREEEDRRKKLGEDVEKNYLRTLGVVDLEVEDDANADAEEGSAVDASNSGGGVDNGTATTGGGGSRTVTKKMALVHWWYHPSSYDEWLPAEDVAGDTETEPPPSGPPGGQQVVGCKFVRDVEIFNEWGVSRFIWDLFYCLKVMLLLLLLLHCCTILVCSIPFFTLYLILSTPSFPFLFPLFFIRWSVIMPLWTSELFRMLQYVIIILYDVCFLFVHSRGEMQICLNNFMFFMFIRQKQSMHTK